MSTLPLQLFKDTLLLIPCSAAKRCGSKPSHAVSILSTLDPARAAMLSNARAALHVKAKVDERTLMPACLRYSGELYQHGSASQHFQSISAVITARDAPRLLVSGKVRGSER